jgi:16S rRNA (cytosine967-C5)-methyltransferase
MNALLIATVFAASLAGFCALGLAMDRHSEDVFGRGSTPGPWRRWLQLGGGVALCLSLVASLRAAGHSIGWVLWLGALTAAAPEGGTELPTGSWRYPNGTRVTDLAGFAEGAFWVQDAAAALPARLLAPRPGERIADIAAAPGGKTAQLAAAGADVTAVDRSADRLTRLKENLARLDLTARVVQADATTFSAEPFDAILLDAPCTATGTLRRHPDVAWSKSPADIATLGALQGRLLGHAVDLLAPGGVLVYSTCSLEPEEGEAQIEALLARRPDVERAPIGANEITGIEKFITPQGDLRTLPSDWSAPRPELSGIDGFFAARLRKRG